MESVVPEVFEDRLYLEEVPDGSWIPENEAASFATLPETSDEPLAFGGVDDNDIGVVLPFPDDPAEAEIEDDVVYYAHDNGSSSVPLPKEDGSLQVVTTIESSDSPTRFDYTFTGDIGEIEVLEDGFVVLRDAAGEFVGGSLPAWAVDANGSAVPTHYEINGSTLTQVVSHTAQDVAYPVIADPYLGKSLISSVKSSTKWNGKTRYNVYKTSWGQKIAMNGVPHVGGVKLSNGPTIMRSQGWTEAKKKGLANVTTLKQQYDCHTLYAGPKNPWNLERARGTNSNWVVNPKLCNW